MCVCVCATTSQQPSFGPRISRTEMSDGDTTGGIYADRGEGEETSPTEYENVENVCRLEFDFASPVQQREGEAGVVLLPPFFLPFSKFFSYYLHEREERNPSDTIERSVIGAASVLESGMDSSGPTFG